MKIDFEHFSINDDIDTLNYNKIHNIIVDLDGTLCDSDYYAKKAFIDKTITLAEYQANMLLFKPREHIKKLLQMYNNRGDIINIVSARPQYLYELSEYWLERENIPYNNIYLKPVYELKNDAEWKYSVIKELEPIEVIIDDNPKVIKYLQQKGYNTFFVNSLYKW